jgi:beta-lactamase regulating signal transducer with metallopeptidase domain
LAKAEGRVRDTLRVQNFLRGNRQNPESLSLSSTELPYEVEKFSAGSLPPPGATLRGGEPNSPSIAVEPLATSTADDQSAWFHTAMRRLANPASLTLGLESRAARFAGVILLSVCLMLSAVRLFLLLLRLQQIRKLKLQSLPASDALKELFQGLVTRLGVGRKVDLKTLPTARSSFVLGFLHPVILLPAEQMEPAEAEQILRHELAHVRRGDDWANLLQHFILAAFPFHPAVWWISKRLSLEREIACDDYVLQSSAHPHAYALLLANLAARMQRCPPLLAPGASNNKTQLQQRIDMILDTRRNTSPRLAATWLTFMASAAALFAVAAICLAPRIVLAQSGAASAAANTQDSLIDEPTSPAVASAAASISPVAAEAASSDAALPAIPKPPALGSGPKMKTGRSWPVPGQPGVVPAPPTAAVLAAPAPLTAQPAPLTSPGSILLSATPAPEPKPGRTPRPARAESTDSALEERLERLEKMVESLMARGYATQNPHPLKRSPDAVGPTINRKQIAEIEAYAKEQAERARKQSPDAKEIEKIREQAKRAALAAGQFKQAAVDAEKAARAEQKRQTRRNFKEGPQRQLDDLRKQLEILEREREKLESQIEELERQQEQLDEQREEEQDSDAQPDASESNLDSPENPRK